MEEKIKKKAERKPKIWYTSNYDKVVEYGINRPLRISNCLDFNARCELFLEECKDDNTPLTIARLCLYLNITEDELKELVTKKYSRPIEEQWAYIKYKTGFLNRMLQEIEADRLEGALSGKQSASLSAFELKNKHKYVDKVETTTTLEFDPKRLYELVKEAKSSMGEDVSNYEKEEDEVDE